MLQEVWYMCCVNIFLPSRLSMYQPCHMVTWNGIAKTFNYLPSHVVSWNAASDAGPLCCYCHRRSWSNQQSVSHVNLNDYVEYSQASPAVYRRCVPVSELLTEHHQTTKQSGRLISHKEKRQTVLCCFFVPSFSWIMPTRAHICASEIFPGRGWVRKAAPVSSTASTESHTSFVTLLHTHTYTRTVIHPQRAIPTLVTCTVAFLTWWPISTLMHLITRLLTSDESVRNSLRRQTPLFSSFFFATVLMSDA